MIRAHFRFPFASERRPANIRGDRGLAPVIAIRLAILASAYFEHAQLKFEADGHEPNALGPADSPIQKAVF